MRTGKYYILLEAETGKCFIKPFHDLAGVVESLHFASYDTVSPSLLPSPFKFVRDGSGLLDGKPINFMASFYYGVMSHNKVIVGDVVVLKDINGLDGLDDIELRFMIFNLNQHFGTVIDHVPA